METSAFTNCRSSSTTSFWNLFPSRGWKLNSYHVSWHHLSNAFEIFSLHGDGCDYRLHDESEYLRNTPGKCLKTSTHPKERQKKQGSRGAREQGRKEIDA